VAWGGLLLTGLAIVVAFVASPAAKPLPILGSVPDFSLTDQDGRTVTLANFQGQPWVADVIFSRCPGQCLVMSSHMKELQAALRSTPRVKLVSITTDPDYDTPMVLKKYGRLFGAEEGRWLFLTGTKAATRGLAVDGFKLAVVDKAPGQQESPSDLFIHSEKFVLVDSKGEIRGYYDGENAGCVPQIAAALQQLDK
jgi:protein SCO1/2